MNAANPDSLTPQSLQHLLQEVEPAALLVPPRILRRVIKQHCGLGGLGLRVPHRKSYILSRDDLLNIASRGELGLGADQVLPETVLLFPAPPSLWLRNVPAGRVLLRYWRLLFHSHVHLALRRLRTAGRLDDASVHERILRIGDVEFEEAREVLRQEHYLLAGAADSLARRSWPGGTGGAYEEFAAVYLELLHFDPHRRKQFFPAIIRFEFIEAVFAADVDSGELFRRTRPAGAFDPEQAFVPEETIGGQEATAEDEPERAAPGWLRWRAEQASQRGNQVRAAVLRQRAVPLVPPSQAGALRAGARAEVERFVGRLQQALQLPQGELADWQRCLLALLPAAARGVWNREVRLLYDLQNVCVDRERELFAVDLVEWLASAFRKPIKRRLYDLPLVLAVKHLRTAASRLPVVRMLDVERQRLGELLQSALHHAESRMRQVLRGKLVAALDAVGLTPLNLAESVAQDKVVEELLDRIIDTGHLSIGDLRDALARNRLKVPDMCNPVAFVTGDPLIRLNRRLAADLDAIYHRGEIYLRWLQRLSSLFFGNPAGRLLTLFLILPLLGSVFILKGFDEIWEIGHHVFGLPKLHTLLNEYSFLAVALFLLPLLHSASYRRVLGEGLYLLWRVVRGLLYDLPAAFLRLSVVRHILQSRPYILFYQFLGKPLAWCSPIVLFLYLMDTPGVVLLSVSAGVLVVVSAMINTRVGMLVEEAATDWLVHTWEMVRDDLVPGLFRWIMWVSRQVRERIERFIYSVDEWLRFRTGDSRLSLYVKPALGLAWFVITYLIRFSINVFVEPTFNPIKHFPVVTVAAKLILPIIPVLGSAIAAALKPVLGGAIATVLAGLIIFFLPGLAGFLAWELKENWRLYRANQSPTIDPVMVGSHGERVIHLVRPGFHAGTLPKLFARLRQAHGSAERKGEDGLHHVEEALRHFIERDLIAVLADSHDWGANHALQAGAIHLGTNRIRFELYCEALAQSPVSFDLANRGGRLMASVEEAGWLGGISDKERMVFRDALAGFYKLSGVQLVREQVAAALPGNARVFLFAEQPLLWTDWVEQWERDRAGKEHEPPLLAGVRLLPATA